MNESALGVLSRRLDRLERATRRRRTAVVAAAGLGLAGTLLGCVCKIVAGPLYDERDAHGA